LEPLFDHERLEVYQLARQFNTELQRFLDELPEGFAKSKDNLRRAAQSIMRNIAEGAGKWKIADKTHYYHIARASATECAASLDELVVWARVPEGRVSGLKEMLARIVAMLISMIRSLESRQRVDMSR
jgi:four helix bundle protein